MSNHLEHGRACYERGAWHGAFEALRLADQTTPLDCDDLEHLGTVAYLLGHELDFEGYFARLFHLHLELGHTEDAAHAAFWLGFSLLFRGAIAQSNAWIARGQRLIGARDCVEQGYLSLPGTERILRDGQAATAQARAANAALIGERFGDADLIAMARHVEARALLEQQEIAAGLELLDEMMLPVVAGELSPITTGLMYCSVLAECSSVHALSRAREWTFAFSRWCDRQPEPVAFSSVCLVHRAQVLQLHGSWSDALDDACRACDRANRGSKRPPAAALYQQGEIHRLRGEHAEAEEAYRAASELGYDPQPGLALLRLAEGQAEPACAMMRRALHTAMRGPERARLLPGCIEVLLASGEMGDAREAWRELREISEALDADVLRAAAAQAEGAIALAEGKPEEAIGSLRRAFDLWTRLDIPYDAARVRTLIATACDALHDRETARLELAAARSVFERLCAGSDLARLDRLMGAAASRERTKLSRREQQVLRLIATGATNKAIAAQLSVSERTVDRHVSNILTKLNVPSRAAAIAFAYEHAIL